MSKELVISAASHERRVAILEEGQLVEIYIEREKEFALVGSIYKGKVTRVLPGMQSAFVDIGLDGDAFLYVSDVFENLEDYDHGHPHEQPLTSPASLPPAIGASVDVLPGETLARASQRHTKRPAPPKVNIPGNKSASLSRRLGKSSTLKLQRNASPNPMLLRRRILPRTIIPRRTIRLAAVTTAPARIMAVAVIVAVVDAGDAVVDAVVAAVRRVARVEETSLPRNT